MVSNYRGRRRNEKVFQLENLYIFPVEYYDLKRSGSLEGADWYLYVVASWNGADLLLENCAGSGSQAAQ